MGRTVRIDLENEKETRLRHLNEEQENDKSGDLVPWAGVTCTILLRNKRVKSSEAIIVAARLHHYSTAWIEGELTSK